MFLSLSLSLSLSLLLWMQTLRSLHIDLHNVSPSTSVQTTTTSLDCASPAYNWTAGPSPVAIATIPGAIPGLGEIRESGRRGSLRRPHPCSVPGTQSAYKRLIPQRHSIPSSSSSTASPTATTQLLSFDDNTVASATEQSRSQLPPIQDGYLETDVWCLCWCCRFVLILLCPLFEICV